MPKRSNASTRLLLLFSFIGKERITAMVSADTRTSCTCFVYANFYLSYKPPNLHRNNSHTAQGLANLVPAALHPLAFDEYVGLLTVKEVTEVG